jgi:hypothetical protein
MALLASALGCGGEAGSGSNSEGGITDSWSGDAPTIGEGASDGVVMDSPSGDAGTGDGSSDGAARGCPITDAGLEDGGPTRVPMNHRPAGSACPQQRAAISPEASTCTPPDSSSCGACTKDSDCTQGTNGRCGYDGPAAYLVCSYDGCFNDSDCDGGAPCQCRLSSTSLAANVCLTGSNCRVDSDCGPGGYCSPSVLELCSCLSTALCGDSGGGCYEYTGSGSPGLPPGPGWTSIPCECGDSCGHGYFCHTRCDTCVDDSDCDGGDTCNYDTLSNRWDCSYCLPPP